MLGNSFRQRIPRSAQAATYQMHSFARGLHTHHSKKPDAVGDNSERPNLNLGTSAAAVGPELDSAKADLAERGSISSLRSDQMIINRTDQWFVHYEDHSKLSDEALNGPSQAGHSGVYWRMHKGFKSLARKKKKKK